MGCDIHLYIEIYSGNGSPFSKEEHIAGFNNGDIYVPRHYYLFDALAGVRHNQGNTCLIPAKGIPKKISHEVMQDYYQYVFDENEEYWDDDYAKRVWADEWVRKGQSEYRDHHLKKKGWVSCPDWHTPSYLVLNEVNDAIDHKEIDRSELSREFRIILSLLNAAEIEYGKNNARAVFWFDN